MRKADQYMKEVIREIQLNGFKDHNPRPKYKDGTPAHTLSVNHLLHTYDINKNEFPITSLRPVAVKNAIKEMLWIYQDQSNSLTLLENKYGIHWWNEWESKECPTTIGQRYGATVKKYNLIDKLLEDIKIDPYGRRHIINLWQEADFTKTDGLLPCAFQTIWNVRNGYLDMCLIQRSSDWITAGNINQIQYVALQMMVSRHCGYQAGKFTHFISNVQLYERHLEQANEILDREPIPCKAILKLNSCKTDFYEIEADDFVLEDYQAVYPQLKLELGI